VVSKKGRVCSETLAFWVFAGFYLGYVRYGSRRTVVSVTLSISSSFSPPTPRRPHIQGLVKVHMLSIVCRLHGIPGGWEGGSVRYPTPSHPPPPPLFLTHSFVHPPHTSPSLSLTQPGGLVCWGVRVVGRHIPMRPCLQLQSEGTSTAGGVRYSGLQSAIEFGMLVDGYIKSHA
jgi:hypothetical protein